MFIVKIGFALLVLNVNIKLNAETVHLGEYKGAIIGTSTILNYNDVQVKNEVMNCDYAANIDFNNKNVGISYALINCKTPSAVIGQWNEYIELIRDGNSLYLKQENGEIDTGRGIVGEVIDDNTATFEITTSRKVIAKTNFITFPYCGLKFGENVFEYNLKKRLKIIITKQNENTYTLSRRDYIERIPTFFSSLPSRHKKDSCKEIKEITSIENLMQKEIRSLEGKLEKKY